MHKCFVLLLSVLASKAVAFFAYWLPDYGQINCLKDFQLLDNRKKFLQMAEFFTSIFKKTIKG